MAIRFNGADSFLSKLYPCRVDAYSRSFRSIENAYQFRKAMFNNYEESAEYIKEAWSAYIAKRRSDTINKTKTAAVRLECMRVLLMTKFTQSKQLRDSLLATGTVELVEGVQ
ncbi:MAG: NADAR family protein [Chromatiales bacterium]